MAPDVPPEGLMEDPTRMRDNSSGEGSDLARRVARLSKGKAIKQSTGIRQEEDGWISRILPMQYLGRLDLGYCWWIL